jgi:hypothetical protein
VIWNGNPLSQFTKAEQTWVDGRKYFSLDEDKVLREEIAKQRAQLIQAVLAAGGDAPAGAPARGPRRRLGSAQDDSLIQSTTPRPCAP